MFLAFRRVSFTFFIVFSLPFSTPAFASANIYRIDLEQQPLVLSLNKLSQIASFPVSVVMEYLEGETAAPLRGYYTAGKL